MMAEKPERTMFDMLALIMKIFSVLVWLTMALVMYQATSAGDNGGPSFIWQEKLAIATVFLMSVAIWWFAGFVTRKGREKEAARKAREEQA